MGFLSGFWVTLFSYKHFLIRSMASYAVAGFLHGAWSLAFPTFPVSFSFSISFFSFVRPFVSAVVRVRHRVTGRPATGAGRGFEVLP